MPRTTTVPPEVPVNAPLSLPQRSDGAESRQRLLHAALALFAEKGFAKTSTREIAQAAGANIAAISYYFGDKAGLYRAAFFEPINGVGGSPSDAIPLFDQPHFTLEASLRGLLESFVAPLKQDELAQQCVRLHFREMIEPTGVWAEQIDSGIKPAHAALVAVLCRHLGLKKADDDVHRLAFSIVGLALQLFINRDVMQAIRPGLIANPRAIDTYVERLTAYAQAMVGAEQARRTNLAASQRTTP